jgi:cbb3-type cytochrome c oxidase subunit II
MPELQPNPAPFFATRWLAPAVAAAVPLVTLLLVSMGTDGVTLEKGAVLGRQVYVAEGCIHCHSQYIRPGTADDELWGDPRDPEFSRRQSPALIGNRRQGPDLMNVGLRRPRDWQRLHLIDPRTVSPDSRMPAYGHLFAPGDPRGEALLDYLDSLGREPGAPPPPENRTPPEYNGVAAAAPPGHDAAGSPP